MITHNAWRMNLDPRDPDYLDPLTPEQEEEEADGEIYVGEGKELFRQWDFDHV